MTKQTFHLINDSIRSRVIDAVKRAPEGFEVILRPRKSKRSTQQNALHWKRLDVIRMHVADSTGQIFSGEELHEFFKAKFLDSKVVEIDEDRIKVIRTTTKLSTKEMSEFMDSIDRYCIEKLNLYLPQPGLDDE